VQLLTLAEIQERLRDGQYRLSGHALARIVERNITEAMIRQVGAKAELIEDYPDDKYSPSCLLLGFSQEGEPLHLHVSRVDGPMVKIITLYRPDPGVWKDCRIRKAEP